MPSTESLSDTLSKTLDVFPSGRESHAPLTTAEVADSLDCTRQAASDRLERLVEQGHLETKKVGDREHVWWLSELPAEDGRDGSPGTADISERMSARLVENVPGMVYRCRNERGWPMEFVSDGCQELTGYDSDALERGELSYGEDLVVEADRDELWTEVQSAVNDGEQFLVNYRIETASGDVRWVRERGRGVFDGEGELEVLEGVIIDVTERKRLESELEDIFGRISDAFYALDDKWRFTYANERAAELIDYQGEGLVGKNFWEVFEWATDSTLGEEYRTAMETQEPTFFEFYYPEPLEAWYEIHAYPSETGLSVYFRDITERKESERELEKSERRYRTLAEHFPNGAVGVYDHDLRYTLVAGEKVGDSLPSAEEIEGTTMPEQYPDDVVADLKPMFRAAIEDGETGSAQTTVAGRHWRAWATPLHNADGEIFAGLSFTQDVTEQVEREAELERALDLLDKTERIADVGGWEIDVDTKDVFWTDHIFDLLEVTADEEPPLDEALDMYHEEDQTIVEDAVENALDSGDPFDVEVRVRTDCGEIHWLRLQGVPETVDDEVVSLRGAAQDVTEQVERERELEETVEQLEEANERLESFASMLAHELRNPVTIGQIYSQQLPAETDSGPDGSGSEAVEYVTEAFDRIEDMIDVMLVLTRDREAVGDSTPLSLADVTRDAWEEVDAPDATLEVEVEAVMQADETYVRHMFRNLFENAVQHGGTDVTVRVGELPTGFYVADDGPGIPPEERNAVFEAGYTTAADEGGTGLGLAFVEELAEVYGWDCDVTESEAGGARFEFRNVDSVTE